MRLPLPIVAALALLALTSGCGKRKKGDAYTMEQVAASSDRACAAMKDGTVRCWGRSDTQFGPAGDLLVPTVVAGFDHVSEVAVSASLLCGLAKGAVSCVGDGAPPTTSAHDLGITDATKVAVGAHHICILHTTGAVGCRGENDHGQLGDGTHTARWTEVPIADLGKAVDVAAAGDTTCVVLEDETVRCWGRGDAGQLGGGKLEDSALPIVVRTLGAKRVSVGGAHACVTLADESAMCWGQNDHGQLGDGTTTSHAAPHPVAKVAIVKTIACGTSHTCARMGDSTIHCWGKNDVHQASLVTTEDTLAPKLVTGLYESVDVAAGGDFSCVRMKDGWLRCWGQNFHGELADGTNEIRAIPNPIKY